ncbi:MAG: hypothetical protein LBU24_01560 [Methanocalculaceae archaeon]|jgi:hypothetical protein|nr:hypothetical protein [Methanocalculaceae archaeon]
MYMIKYAKAAVKQCSGRAHTAEPCHVAALVLLMMVAVCCGGASAATAVEDLNVTYPLGGIYTDAEAVASSSDGGFFLGLANSSGAVLMKVDSAGKEIWRTALPGKGVRSIAALADNGCVMTTITRVVDGSKEAGYTFGGDTTLLRTDGTGTIVWQLPLHDVGAGDIAVSGNTISFAGWFWKTNVGFTQTYLLSTGAPGNDQILLGNATSPMIPFAMLVENDGTLVLIGGTTAYFSEENKSDCAWIAKVNGGVVQKQSVIRIGSSDPRYGDGACGYAITKAYDGGYIMVGSNPPFGVTQAPGLGWAAHVKADLSHAWVNDLPRCYAPYAVIPFGDGYLVAGMDGYDDPVWLTLSIGGAITELNKISQNGVHSTFKNAASISSGKAALVGGVMLDSLTEGILIVLSDPKTPGKPSGPADFTLWIIGGIVCILTIAGVLYFFVIRKPASEPAEKKAARKGGKKN